MLATLVLAAAVAATPTPSPTPSEIGRVTTSDRQEEPLRAAARTTFVVTKDEMVRRGSLSVADAIAQVPGVSLSRYGPSGALVDVYLRGAGPSQVLVLLDGRPIGGAQTGTIDLGIMPTAGLERIEIVEGSGATLYGTGAIGGVINLLTAPQPGESPRLMLGGGSLGERDVAFEGRNLSFERHLATNAYRPNSDMQATSGTLRVPFRLGVFDAYANAGLRTQAVGVPGPVDFESLTSRQNTLDAQAFFRLQRASAHATTSLELSGTRSQLLFSSNPDDPNGCSCYVLNVEGRLQASMRQELRSERNRFVAGIDAARGSARIDAGDGNPPTKGFAQTAIYAQDSYLAGNARFYAGVRAERDGGYGGSLAPSLGTVARLTGDLTLRANYATGFRAPTILDLYYPGFSNPNLRPERTNGGDVRLTSDAILGGLSLGWFFMNGVDLIAPTADFTTVVNIQKASLAGLTLDARTPPLHGISATLGIVDLYRALDLTTTATRLPRRPVFTVNGGIEYQAVSRAARLVALGILSASVGERDPGGGAPAYSRIDAYARIRVARDAIVSLRGYNLGGERYAEVPGYPLPGRALRIDLSNR